MDNRITEKRIPKSLELMGHVISVEFDRNLTAVEGMHGLAKYAERKIVLQSCEGDLAQSTVEQVFWHELTHHILELALEDDINPPMHTREGLVDRVGSLLHQAMKSAVYEDSNED